MPNTHDKHLPVIYVALPVMDEVEYIGACLGAIKKQTYTNYKVYACVNQPDSWWDVDEKRKVCENNRKTLELLRKEACTLIDKSSQGNGWQQKDAGVGWARKTGMDAINSVAADNDIIISLDADTVFDDSYFESVVDLLTRFPERLALANPYYHRLSGDDTLDRAMLRYEIYMRTYAINLWQIQSPYAFTALGSAIALPVRAYRKTGGITPKKSGEDFYFLQKLCKTGKIITWNKETVYPATRYSGRVFFGTGPALIKGSKGDWNSYPIYHRQIFNEIQNTCSLFEKLYTEDVPVPMSEFIQEHFSEDNIWQPLRKNARSPATFVAACHQKIDGLRILQYLKWRQPQLNVTDETALIDFLDHNKLNKWELKEADFSFSTAAISLLDAIRNTLAEEEKKWQYNDLFH